MIPVLHATPFTMSAPILRAAGLFQALLTAPVALALGSLAFVDLFDNYDSVYQFLTYTINGLLAVIILFILLLQRQLSALPTPITLVLESTKSALASAMWIWLLCDSAFAEHRRYRDDDRFVRVLRALIAGLALLVLFYPTAAYAWYVARLERRKQVLDGGERAPLLGREGDV